MRNVSIRAMGTVAAAVEEDGVTIAEMFPMRTESQARKLIGKIEAWAEEENVNVTNLTDGKVWL